MVLSANGIDEVDSDLGYGDDDDDVDNVSCDDPETSSHGIDDPVE